MPKDMGPDGHNLLTNRGGQSNQKIEPNWGGKLSRVGAKKWKKIGLTKIWTGLVWFSSNSCGEKIRLGRTRPMLNF